jgi:uncharacterized protein
MPVVTLLVVLALLAAGTAVVARRIADGMLVPEPYGLQPEFTVQGVVARPDGGHVVRLPRPPDRPAQFARTDVAGSYGLLWEVAGGIGHGRLGPVVALGDGWLERPLTVVAGPPPEAGAAARIDTTLHRRDPLADLGVPFEELRLPGPVGDVAAWWIEREPHDAIVMVHGRRRGDRREALRALPAALATGASVLVTSYRNHDASAASPSGLFTYGRDEADDLLAALAWLRERGVRRVALVSYSMGSAVALVARGRWPGGGPELVGLVMDSPLVDPREVVRAAVARSGAPFPIRSAALGLALAARRAGVSWETLDLRRLVPDLDVPLLLIGAVADTTVPIALVDELAAAAPADRLDYWRVDGAGHVEAYNLAPDVYEARVGAFLEGVLAPPPVSPGD